MLLHHLVIGAKELLQSISEKQGRRMSSTESTKDIPKFVESFKACSIYYSMIFLMILCSEFDFLKVLLDCDNLVLTEMNFKDDIATLF